MRLGAAGLVSAREEVVVVLSEDGSVLGVDFILILEEALVEYLVEPVPHPDLVPGEAVEEHCAGAGAEHHLPGPIKVGQSAEGVGAHDDQRAVDHPAGGGREPPSPMPLRRRELGAQQSPLKKELLLKLLCVPVLYYYPRLLCSTMKVNEPRKQDTQANKGSPLL